MQNRRVLIYPQPNLIFETNPAIYIKILSFYPLVDNLAGDWIIFYDVACTCGIKLFYIYFFNANSLINCRIITFLLKKEAEFVDEIELSILTIFL
jgi:hypothetical protein